MDGLAKVATSPPQSRRPSVTESSVALPPIQASGPCRYRAFIVGPEGHFIGYEGYVCADDEEATEKAKLLANGHDLEPWSGARRVTILRHQHPSNEVRALNRQVDQSQRMSENADRGAPTERMDKLTSDLTRERDDDQQKRDDEKEAP